ncbi:hypothetical protein [Aeromonas dhakensis]|uniref:hypothetical protein n=1 Tax=Aeromonas dhakensis TaxID=196024 RepID=UPI00288DB1A1|nr:hypothetical protein [Aeromonas dhakensis]HDX9010339.1 hypothetical protein [Aeromonas dhakensis]
MYTQERLVDLDEMVLRCRTTQAKEYISEAVSCYRGGAYRAVIVNTWVAIIYDLIDKIRELSISGDAAAKKIIDGFERYQKQIDEGNEQAIKSSLEFERNILDISKNELQFFDKQQYLDLQRLREDRHRCAHPSFHREDGPYKPSAEQARMHLRNAIVHVLSQPPVQGKSAINKIMSLISSQYFPRDTEKAKAQLSESELAKPTGALIKGIVDNLMFGFVSDNNLLYRSHNVMPALNAVLELHRAPVEARLTEQINKIFRDVPDKDLICAIYMTTQLDPMWHALSDASKSKISTYISNAKTEESLPLFRFLIKLREYEPAIKQQISMLDEKHLSDGINLYELAPYSIDRAIEIYGSSRNWMQANSIYESIINPIQSILTKENINQILSLPQQKGADLIGSNGFYNFIRFVKESKLFEPDELEVTLEQHDLSQYK